VEEEDIVLTYYQATIVDDTAYWEDLSSAVVKR
jgi:hypothetical protein